MTGPFPQLDVLPAAQRAIWPQLGFARDEGFVLYGGTAVALQLGHRQSLDFDFFTDRDFQPGALLAKLPFARRAEVIQEAPNTVGAIVQVQDEGIVKLSFFGGLGFGRLADPRETPDRVMQIASLEDLLAHKLKVMLQRVEARDYVDMAAILASGLALADGLAGAAALYPGFPVQEALKALTYFKGGDLHLLASEHRERLVAAASTVRALPPASIVSRRLGGAARSNPA